MKKKPVNDINLQTQNCSTKKIQINLDFFFANGTEFSRNYFTVYYSNIYLFSEKITQK